MSTRPLKLLTASDLDLIEKVTGERVDPDSGLAPPFAMEIVMRRQSGYLAPGQEVTGVVLKDMSRPYEVNKDPDNPIGPYLDKALAYLASIGRTGVDVSA
ncbi:hypothetical protein [Actinoplanes sp. NPDC049802]|uniref:hypothetical protein n=1 Tax=Actinoplanes sp. NPDC049802 TaxID=3154742 RepID=UPI0033EC6454